jgi:hypothetical protein
MARKILTSGSPPVLWSVVDDAFNKINDNFTELYLSVGGGEPIDLTGLSTSVSPSTTETYDLGSNSKRWRDLYLSGSSLHLGDAVITSSGSIVELPEGSTIGGSLLDNTYFKSIAVSGQSTIVAESGGEDILTVASGTGISLTTNATTDTLTITNSGVTSAVAGTGIGVSSATGAVTFTNTGVTSATAGTGISVSSSTGGVTISNAGVVSVVTDPGSGISLDTSVPGVVRVTNSAPNIIQQTFRYVRLPNLDLLDADSASDTLSLLNGTGISITGNSTTDSITIANTGVTSIAASTGISVSAASGSISISNLGVINISAGDGINVSAGSGNVVVSNTRVGFTSIGVVGQDPVLADNTTDTLVLIAGTGVELTTDPATDSITISANANLQSNVYGIDSTLLVDAENSQLVGDVNTSTLRTSETTIALGANTGETNQGNSAIAIGALAGQTSQGYLAIAIGSAAGNTSQGSTAIAIGSSTGLNQGDAAVAIGDQAGATSQGDYAIAIGYQAGQTNQPASSIVINASGSALDGSAAGFYVDPIRELTGPQVLYYDPSGKEITWGPVPAGGSFGGGGGSDYTFNIAADDSTQITIFNGETIKIIGSNGISTSSDAEGNITISSDLNDGLGSGFSFDSGTGLTVMASTGAVEVFGVATSQVYIGGGSGGSTSGDVNLGNGTNVINFNSSTSGISYNDLSDTPTIIPSRTTVSEATSSLADGATDDLTIIGFKGYLLYKIETSVAAWVRIYTDTTSQTNDSSRDELTDPTPGSGVIAEVITTGAETVLISPGTFGFNNDGTPSTNIYLAVKNKSGGTTTVTVTLTILQVEA